MRSVAFCAFFVFTLSLGSRAQNTSVFQGRFLGNFVFRFDYQQGKILKVFPSQPQTGITRYYNFNFLWQADGLRDWHSRYNFPEVGVNCIVGNHGNDSMMGSSIGLIPNMILKIRGQKTFGFYFKLGSGFAWFFKPYDRIKNPQNIIIGSHITNVTMIGCNAFVKLTPSCDIHAGYSLIHYSTGHVRIPNVGSNDLPWNVGFAYKPFKRHIDRQPWIDTAKKELVFNVRLSLGFHEFSGTVSPTGSPLFPIYAITPFLSRRLTHVGRLRAGVCFAYYTSFYDFLKKEELYIGKEPQNSCVISAIAGWEWLFGRMSLLVEPAINVYNPFYQMVYIDQNPISSGSDVVKRWVALRTGFMYYLLDKAKYPRMNPAVGLYIKTNRDQADYVEMSVSCGL